MTAGILSRKLNYRETDGVRTSLPASLPLAIWASNSSLVWHAITVPSAEPALPVPSSLLPLGAADLGFLSGAGCLAEIEIALVA